MVTRPAIQVNGTPEVQIQDTKVLIKQLVVDDHDLAEYLAAAQDQIQAIVEALRLGVRILRLAGTSGDVEMVKHEFDAMMGGIGTNVEQLLAEARKTIENRLTQFSTEELQKSLNSHREELKNELVRYFGPESAVSVLKQVDKMLEEQAAAYRQGLAQVIEPSDDPDNAFNKLRRGVSDEVKRATDEIKGLRDEVMKVVGAAAERERGTAKGRAYQEYVHEEVERIARVYGDTARYVADEPGEKGKSKAGDVLVELNAAQTGNVRVAIVFEAKNSPNISVKTILGDLDDAMENRAASAAVAVFSSAQYVPAGLSTWRDYPGHRYVCVLREDETDPFALELSYRWTRFDALRSIEVAEAALDVTAVRGLLKQVRARLGELQQMRTKLGGARDAIIDVQSLIEKYQDAMRRDLDQIDALFAPVEETETQ